MAQYTPKTWTTGETITAAELNALEQGAAAAAVASGLATVATTGAYADLSGKPTIPAAAADATTTSKGIVQLAGDLAGTAAAPTVPGLAAKVSSSVTAPGAAAPQVVSFSSATFNAVVDPILKIGYNADGGVAGQPVIRLAIEGDYMTSATDPNTQWTDGLAHHTSEVYFEYQSPDHTTVSAFRPLYLGITRDDNTSQSSIITFDVGTKGFPLSQFNVKAGSKSLLSISEGSFFLGAISLTMEAVGAQFRSTATADSAADFFGNGTKQWCWSLKTTNASSDFIFMDPRNSFRSHIALSGGASNTAALSTFNSSVKVNGNFGVNGVTPVGKAGAIASPTSDTVGTKTAIDSIRAALTAVGITA